MCFILNHLIRGCCQYFRGVGFFKIIVYFLAFLMCMLELLYSKNISSVCCLKYRVAYANSFLVNAESKRFYSFKYLSVNKYLLNFSKNNSLVFLRKLVIVFHDFWLNAIWILLFQSPWGSNKREHVEYKKFLIRECW